MKLIIDVETNGFLDKLDKIHCVVFKDIDTNLIYSYNPDNLEDALELLKKATLLIGHNITGFDIPAIKKVFNYDYRGAVFDTLLCSRLIWTNRQELDFKLKEVPPKLIGKHSLESYGYRVGLRKGDFKENNTFDIWTQEMQDYCELDVEVTHKLFLEIVEAKYSPDAIKLEHDFAVWINKQIIHGVPFDERSAETLHSILTKKRLEISDKLSLVFSEWKKSTGFKTYKRDNIKRGIKEEIIIDLKKYGIHINADLLCKFIDDNIPSKFVKEWNIDLYSNGKRLKNDELRKLFKEKFYKKEKESNRFKIVCPRLNSLPQNIEFLIIGYLVSNNNNNINEI